MSHSEHLVVFFRIAILVALVGCGADTPSGIDRSITTCDISTGSNAGMQCERPCATHRDETGIPCEAHSIAPPPNGTDVTCPGTFGLEGTIGCCLVVPGTSVLRYAECL
jgi:hypothetical protein